MDFSAWGRSNPRRPRAAAPRSAPLSRHPRCARWLTWGRPLNCSRIRSGHASFSLRRKKRRQRLHFGEASGKHRIERAAPRAGIEAAHYWETYRQSGDSGCARVLQEGLCQARAQYAASDAPSCSQMLTFPRAHAPMPREICSGSPANGCAAPNNVPLACDQFFRLIRLVR